MIRFLLCYAVSFVAFPIIERLPPDMQNISSYVAGQLSIVILYLLSEYKKLAKMKKKEKLEREELVYENLY